MEPDRTREAVQVFYDRHPYPPPVADLDDYRQRWQDEGRRRADFHLFWPGKPYREDLKVLVAGCGTSQAAKYALRQPASHVVGIDVSETSIQHTLELKRKYYLANLEVDQMPLERVGDLGRSFDKIVCTGVLHHLPDPQAGLSALREVLEPGGAIHLMVYAAYGRAGIYMLQEYCRRLGIGHTGQEIRDLAFALTSLPYHHPLAHLLAESPDFQKPDALADALLNPRDRAYTVPQLYELVKGSKLDFGRWVRQAPYLVQCGSLAKTPHTARLEALPVWDQYTAAELFRGNMLRHNLVAYRDDRPGGLEQPRFDGERWLSYIPLRVPETLNVKQKLPFGAAAVLINPAHSDPDLILPVDANELRLVEAIDGKRALAEIVRLVWGSGHSGRGIQQAKGLFERLFWYDQVVFDASQV